MRAHLLRKAYMVHDQMRLRPCCRNSNSQSNRVPLAHLNAPRLNDALIGQKLNVSPRDYPTKTRKSAARITADFCRRTAAEFAELLGVQKRVIHALLTRLEYDFCCIALAIGILSVCDSDKFDS